MLRIIAPALQALTSHWKDTFENQILAYDWPSQRWEESKATIKLVGYPASWVSVHLRLFTEPTQETLISLFFMKPLCFMNNNGCHVLMIYYVSGTVYWWFLDTVIFTPLVPPWGMYFYAYFMDAARSGLILIILHYNVFLLKRHFPSIQE